MANGQATININDLPMTKGTLNLTTTYQENNQYQSDNTTSTITLTSGNIDIDITYPDKAIVNTPVPFTVQLYNTYNHQPITAGNTVLKAYGRSNKNVGTDFQFTFVQTGTVPIEYLVSASNHETERYNANIIIIDAAEAENTPASELQPILHTHTHTHTQ